MSNAEYSKLSKFKLGYEKLETEPQLIRDAIRRIKAKRKATLKRKQERENTKGKKK